MAVDKGRAVRADPVGKARGRLAGDIGELHLEIEQSVAQPAQLVAVGPVTGGPVHRHDRQDHKGQLARHDGVLALVMPGHEQVEIIVGVAVEQGAQLGRREPAFRHDALRRGDREAFGEGVDLRAVIV